MFKKRGFHHALSLDVAGSRSAAPVLRAAAQALKPNGQLVFVQLVSTTPLDPGDAAIGAWVRVERRDGLVPSEACITQTLAEMRFDVRVVEDVTERHRRSVMRGWAALVRVLGAPKPTPTAAAAIVREAELWMRRERLMQTGQLRLMRWHAIGPG